MTHHHLAYRDAVEDHRYVSPGYCSSVWFGDIHDDSWQLRDRRY